jgi:GTPase SAR1 family protein
LFYSVPAVSEKTQHYFDAAMMDGEVSLRNDSALLLGVGGSGKTLVLAAFLKEDPPSTRESTPCAKKPVRAVAHIRAGVSDDHFVRITDDHYSDMLVANIPQSTDSVAVAKPSTQAEAKDDLNSLASSSSSSQKETTRQPSSVKVDASRREEIWCVHRAMKRQYLSRMQEGAKKKSDLDDKDLLDVDDTGGQPMFHEVLPVFIQNTMFGVLTVKLNELFDNFPLVEFYARGERIGEPFNSPFTHLDTLRHCMRVIRSTCDRNTCPKIAFVGTHKDLQHECPQESIEMKEKKLRGIIPLDNIIVHGESLLLAVNVKTP